MKSTRCTARELQSPRTTVMKLLHKHFTFNAYKVQLVQVLQQNDSSKGSEFATEILDRIFVDKKYLNLIYFSDE